MKLSVISTILVISICNSANADNCTTLIQYGLRDEIQSMASANNYQESVNQLCQDFSSFKEDKKSGNLKASYGAFKGSAGYSSERYEAISEALCSSNTNISALKSESSLTNRLLNPAALDALKHCESLNASGLKVTTDIPDAAQTITISFYLSPIPGTSVVQEIRVGKPRADNGIQCDEPSPELVDGKLPALTTVTYTCTRTISNDPFTYLGKRIFAKEGTITIPTSSAPITRRIPAVFAERPIPTGIELRIADIEAVSPPIGSIFASMSGIDEMKKSNSNFSKYWALADGSVVDRSSKYFQAKTDGSLNNVRLPDLRGLFLRGLNVGRSDGKQDPDGATRVVGDFQADSISKHDHGRGMANWPDSGVGGVVRPNGGRDQHPDHWNPRYIPPVSYGSTETRPKNASVYYFIRIN